MFGESKDMSVHKQVSPKYHWVFKLGFLHYSAVLHLLIECFQDLVVTLISKDDKGGQDTQNQ